ncbi:MAG: cell division protein FtsA [Bdellovibrionota bacterium]
MKTNLKANSSNETIIAALDIGTTKVCILIAAIKNNLQQNNSLKESSIDIIGVGTAPSHGLRKGVVVNIEATTEAIRRAREEAELMAGVEIEEIWIGVAGSHIKSFDSRGMVALRKQEVEKEDIARVLEAAKAIAVPHDREVLHVIPREYKLDDQDGIADPIGMSGVRLESQVHIVTASKSALQNILKCSEKANLKVAGVVLQQLASAQTVLSEDEKKLGVAVIDMGGGTTDLVIYVQGSVAYTSSLPVGGAFVTNDVAVGLRCPQVNAEELKKKYGCALASLVDPAESVEVEGVGGRKPRAVLRQHLCEVIEPRAEEILSFINNDIVKSGYADMIGSGLVVTGGASQLDGLIEMGEFMLDLPIRRGLPKGIGGLTSAVQSSSFATAVGLILHGAEHTKNRSQKTRTKKSGENDMISGLVEKFKTLMNDIF